jgi:hypothetical protein
LNLTGIRYFYPILYNLFENHTACVIFASFHRGKEEDTCLCFFIQFSLTS